MQPAKPSSSLLPNVTFTANLYANGMPSRPGSQDFGKSSVFDRGRGSVTSVTRHETIQAVIFAGLFTGH